ncbi:ATP-binding cassette domain-containing protein [Rhizobium aegyptiacum]|uniref:ATP-binding cassette domain-containing protein n=1 Tax=Rhizobium aegyptiacum TaxID=1764550 RepID=UPI0007E55966|nr:ATP-binding cassette domain-containing protein [Rhizobium aegyptiacum]
MTKDSFSPLLELKEITKSFGRVHSLRGINMDVKPGEVLGLLGDNGAGKSTLIKVFAGVHQPTSGQIIWQGQQTSLESPRAAMAKGISVVYQDLGIIPLLSIYRNFFLGREEEVSVKLPGLMLLKKRQMREIARKSLSQLGIHITDVDLTVARLSGGERQSIAIARAVHFQSKLLILDEPTAALSLKETAKVLAYIQEAKRQGVSVVFITHNISHAYEVCDRFTVLYHGKVAETTSREDVSEQDLANLINTGTRASRRLAV